ncbi:hypothetical protein Vretimale_12759 [Volvox reticuliferus]|uniref:Uncharacterized protein n=1 Tax=Volvox reticuliferus TaxID=1737510 RepID=A0A8J4FPY1_9CHLO|nr:hypothetical protein Vretifemale_10228 [Volvox reticuliferus]GIM08814.1 hypothetical protein Vretimale_12759 [Volvox reticuliferus]
MPWDGALGLHLLLLLWLAVVGNIFCCSAAKDDFKAKELMDAINDGYQLRLTNWNEAIMNDTHSNLKLERILWSSKPPRFQFTVFTQLTVNRLPTLFNMCTTYTGPMSAAIFVSLVQQPPPGRLQGDQSSHSVVPSLAIEKLSSPNIVLVEEALQQVQEFHDRVESNPDMCQLDIMLFYELYDSEQARLLYPVNYLRNYARLQVSRLGFCVSRGEMEDGVCIRLGRRKPGLDLWLNMAIW